MTKKKKEEQIELDFEEPKYIGNPDSEFNFYDISQGLKKKQEQFDKGISGGVNVKGHLSDIRKMLKKGK